MNLDINEMRLTAYFFETKQLVYTTGAHYE
jgi:hypothetical protein